METIQIGSTPMQLNRKAIKNLHISVLPPDGKVRISAPVQMTDTAIRMAVINRIPWIKKQQRNFAKQPRQSKREMINGECHYIWGQRYRLNVVIRHGRHEVKLARGKIQLFVNPETSLENKALVLQEYYREILKQRIEILLNHWCHVIGVNLGSWRVRQMKTKWGSCNIEEKRIWLNLELAKKPPECLEYILVHELVHLKERKHSEQFKLYMSQYLPNWKDTRDVLNKMPLVHSDWITNPSSQ